MESLGIACNYTYLSQLLGTQPRGWNYTASCPYLGFEEIDAVGWNDVAKEHPEWCFYAGGAYLVTIFALQHWMENRPPLDLRGALFLWNLGLGVYSLLAFVRTLPGLMRVLLQTENGFYNSVCVKTGMDVPTAFYMVTFMFSKYLELGDTVFIVLRKRPLVFLQWYHHLVTMCGIWIAAPFVEPISRWYMVLNFGVHALMYPYFAAKAVGIRVPRFLANVITTLQLLQMVVGLSINSISVGFQWSRWGCDRDPRSVQIFGVIYATFLGLFGKLFYDSVIKNGRKRDKKPEKKID